MSAKGKLADAVADGAGKIVKGDKGSKKTAPKGSKKKDAAAAAKDNAKGGKTAAEAPKGKGGVVDWAKNNKLKAGALGAAGLGATVWGVNTLGAEDGGIVGAARAVASDSPTVGSTSPSLAAGESLELDPDRMASFTAGLRHLSDRFTTLSTAMREKTDALKTTFAADAAGVATADGRPSPGIADLYEALDGLEARFRGVAGGVARQLSGDAARLDAITEKWMEVQEEGAAAVESIDTAL